MRGYCLMSILLLMWSMPVVIGCESAWATAEYAAETGQDCAACHLNPSGGGELTDLGDGFALSLITADGQPEPSATQTSRSMSFYVRLLAGYIHILFAFFWFGTILYVHLILKPAYASGGLPRGEVKLGLASMLIMALTGVVLTAYRVPSVEFLYTTRFGILLCLKILFFLIMVCSALIVVLFIGPRLKRKATGATEATSGTITVEALSKFDGKDNRPAYVAYRGDIYDVTASSLWSHGNHVGRHPAGHDLTEVLQQAPHGEDKILNMPKVGTLQTGSKRDTTMAQKVFYVMTYMNLGFVLLIILILTLWKWW
ncbi:MAG: cytochrome b5 domain-containing protein [Pelovirga sp.]